MTYLNNFFSKACEKNQCCYCNGTVGNWRAEDVNGGGQTIPAHWHTCPHCVADPGKPFPEQRAKALLEVGGKCSTCGFKMDLHEGEWPPHGCTKATWSIIRDLQDRVRILEPDDG